MTEFSVTLLCVKDSLFWKLHKTALSAPLLPPVFFLLSCGLQCRSKPSQLRSTFSGFSRCDLEVFAEAKPPI